MSSQRAIVIPTNADLSSQAQLREDNISKIHQSIIPTDIFITTPFVQGHTHINKSFQYHSELYLIFATVKGIALILALIIFSTSLKASAFASGLVGAVKGEITASSCCKKSDDFTMESCDESEDNQEDSGCCEGLSCNCTCCLHLAYLQHFSNISLNTNDFSEVKFGYSFLYQADYLTSVFHPPSFL